MASSTNTELAGRTALVTGGTRGIGLAISRSLRDAGCSVVDVAGKATSQITDAKRAAFRPPFLVGYQLSRGLALRELPESSELPDEAVPLLLPDDDGCFEGCVLDDPADAELSVLRGAL